MVDGEPGAGFEDEVVIRRLRFARRGHRLRGRRRRPRRRRRRARRHARAPRGARAGADRRRAGRTTSASACRSRSRSAEPLAPSGDEALLAYLRARQARRARRGPRGCSSATATTCWTRSTTTRARRSGRPGLNPQARERGDPVLGRAALHPRAAPAARAARARVAGRRGSTSEYGDRAPPRRARAPVRADERVRRGLPRSRTRSPARRASPPTARARRAPRVLHVLTEAERDGSTCLPRRRARRARAASCSAAPRAGRRAAAARWPTAGELVLEVDASGAVVGLPPPDRRARGRAGRARRATLAGASRAPPEATAAPPDATTLDARRPSSGRRCGRRSRTRLSIVTGGPGTGKTATIRLICAAARRAARRRSLLVAPTGRAARRMAESTGLRRLDVHSALGWIPGAGPDRRGRRSTRDLLVVDETSMANLELLVTLLRAVGPRTHVVLVGDADQLAPVGAGKPFAELVARAAVPGRRAHAHLPPGRRAA